MKETRETRFFGSPLQNLVSGAQTRHRLTAWVALFFFLVWAFSTHSHVGSFNDRSRMAAIESLVQRGTWVIDESPFSRTVDRIYADGHFYSDKPPSSRSSPQGYTPFSTRASISRWTPVGAIWTRVHVTAAPSATTARIGPITCSR